MDDDACASQRADSVQVAALRLQQLCAESRPSLARVALQQLTRALEERSAPALETVQHLIERSLPRVPTEQLRIPPFRSLDLDAVAQQRHRRRPVGDDQRGQGHGRPTGQPQRSAAEAHASLAGQ